MADTVPVRLDRETIETLDLLVKLGLYDNRSEAVRGAMKRGLVPSDELRRLGELMKRIGDLDSRGRLDLQLDLEREAR